MSCTRLWYRLTDIALIPGPFLKFTALAFGQFADAKFPKRWEFMAFFSALTKRACQYAFFKSFAYLACFTRKKSSYVQLAMNRFLPAYKAINHAMTFRYCTCLINTGLHLARHFSLAKRWHMQLVYANFECVCSPVRFVISALHFFLSAFFV